MKFFKLFLLCFTWFGLVGWISGCASKQGCDGVNCGNGSCVEEGGLAKCVCEDGYEAQGLTCVEKAKVKMGQVCQDSSDCETGWCLKYGDQNEGYCSKKDCGGNNDCTNYGTDGAQMCCVDLGGNFFVCLKIGVGYECGDGTGTCGSSCAGQMDSACDSSLACLSTGIEDPNAFCGHECTVPNDCSDCADPLDPNVEFDCLPIQGGITFCLPVTDNSCSGSNDCEGDQVCVAVPTSDMTELEGMCTIEGKKAIGAICDDNDDPNQLDFADKCIGFFCILGHCTEVCTLDSDCTVENMVCGLVNFKMDAAGNVASIGMCQWMDGSNLACSGDASCRDAGNPDEICNFYLPPNADVKKVCVTEQCDFNNDDSCAGPGEECGDGKDSCYNSLCLTNGVNSWCSALCDTHADCTEYGMICGGLRISADQVTGACSNWDGSARPCNSDLDCVADPNAVPPVAQDEACTYLPNVDGGIDALCTTKAEGENVAGLGEDCSSDPCYNDLCLEDNAGNNFCGAVCQSSADCPSGFLCGGLRFQNIEEVLGTCTAAPGSGNVCVDDSSCAGQEPAESCQYNQTPLGLESICLEEIENGGRLGDDCTNGCYNDLCLENSQTQETWCSAVCHSHQACRDLKPDESGWFCGSLGFEVAEGEILLTGACSQTSDGSTAEACYAESQCTTAGETCTFLPVPGAPIEQPADAVCVKEITAGASPGQACDDQNPCGNDLCLTDGYCAAVCTTNTDCLSYDMECQFIGLPDGLFGAACVQKDDLSPLCSQCIDDDDCTIIDPTASCHTNQTTLEQYCTLPCTDTCPNGYSCQGSVCLATNDTCIP